MFYYRIAKLTLQSECRLDSFGAFACEPSDADISLEKTNEIPPSGTDLQSGMIFHRVIPEGWFFHLRNTDNSGLFVSSDYSRLRFLGARDDLITGMHEWLVRIALECRLARMGYVSLHSAAVEVNDEAYAFTAPSGVGKSTRAAAWIEAFEAKLINGDRPLIDARRLELFGIPWDGKEKCYRNVHYPLKAICEVRRSNTNYIRRMSFDQRRKLLLRQCFLPMWDTETTAIQMINIVKLAANAKIVRAFCGPTAMDAQALKCAFDQYQFLKEEPDMTAKPGFVLRNIVDEYILMPTGDNISKFSGTVLLNQVSAFVWEKLQTPQSRDDLLQAILDEYEVEKQSQPRILTPCWKPCAVTE